WCGEYFSENTQHHVRRGTAAHCGHRRRRFVYELLKDICATAPAMKRLIYTPEHELFRDNVTRFLQDEVKPNLTQWATEGSFGRQVFSRAGAAGLLCPTVPEAHGGAGADPLYSAVILEAAAPFSNF